MDNKKKTGRALLIIFIALAVVAGISFMPLEKWSGGKIKNFNLLSDILPDSLLGSDSLDITDIDPALLKAREDEKHVAQQFDAEGNAIYTDTIIGEKQPNMRGDTVVIEDYTTGTVGLYHFKKALTEGRLARATVVGDSYIEGDIFTQDLREMLQSRYGGAGTGYMGLYSDFPGFRRSVKQGGQGWTLYQAGKKGKAQYIGLAEGYFMPKGNALSTYEGVTEKQHADRWNNSKFLFIAPSATTLMVKTSGDWSEYPVTASDKVQCIEIKGSTSEFDLRTSDKSLIGLGVWLNDTTGVAVDCMSSRGYSGITLSLIDKDLCRQMSQWVNYDLIILEFGINAMSAKQTDYHIYCNRLVEVINHVRNCYPGADILLMGIGDRGEKQGGVVKSMRSCPYMIDAQREAARRAHCLFWDTRQAMGGEDAIVKWSSEGLANKDYIHMTHKGGKVLATRLYTAIELLLK